METALKTAKNQGHTVPKNIFIYMDDCWCTVIDPPRRPGLRNNNIPHRDPAAEFNDDLNSVHERVQFTREEEENCSIAFLDVFITRSEDGKLTTRVYRKPSNTNIGLKPQSCQDPRTVTASFKGELCRCYRLCSSPAQVKKEIDFTLDLYEDNGHDRATLQKIADTYTPPTSNNNNNNNKKQTKKQKQAAENQTRNLFNVLPFRFELLGEEEEEILFACIEYIPEVAPQLRRALKKAGVNTNFKAAPKLKDILCNRNKTRPEPSMRKGVYKYTCTCNPKATYIGQTSRSYNTRWEEHGKAIQKQQYHHSGITQHYEHCQHNFNKENFEVVKNMQHKNKRRLIYDLKIREALEIRHHNSGPGKGLNEDTGAYVRTDIWDPVLNTMGNSSGNVERGANPSLGS